MGVLDRPSSTLARHKAGTRHQVWPFGLVTAGFGVVALLSAVRVALPSWVRPAAHMVGHFGRLPGVLFAIGLLVVAHGLLRRRKVAYWLALVLAACGVLTAGRSLLAILLVVGGVTLVVRRSAFPAIPDPARIRGAVIAALITLAVGGIYDVAVHGHQELQVDRDSLLVLAVSVALIVLLAPAPAPKPGDEDTRERVKHLVEHPTADTLAPFMLRRDKAYVFSRDGRAVLGYRVLFGVAVVGGDPVGSPGSFADAIDQFVRDCDRAGWRIAVLGMRDELAPLWQRHGLHTMGIGDEVVLDVNSFTLSGREMRNVRQAVQRTRNAGVTTSVVREGDLSEGLRTELTAVSTGWLNGSRERGFSMILDELLTGTHPDCVVIIARDGTGRAVGFQRYAPCGPALSLDSMRRDRSGPNGLNERMIADLVTYARDRGIRTVSLNFAAFRTLIDAGDERTGVARLGYRTMHLLDPFIQVESLYRFNAKFRPGYLARGIAFPSLASIPIVAAAMIGMEFSHIKKTNLSPADPRS
nr:Putative membrane protein found fused to lysyl-tRNA synthetase like protein / Lysyl-tRNA synthetase (class II) related protein found fused to membrane protein [Kibdelosporangium sp. MJ126-NF4]